MPEFILDTSGAVVGNGSKEARIIGGLPMRWADLDAFTQGYIEALFFTEEGEDNLGEAAFADLAPETLASIVEDCRKFQEGDAYKAMKDAKRLSPTDAAGGLCTRHHSATHAGRDFWYTRNGHGCGFWDGDWPEPHDKALEALADTFSGTDVYLGDDGKVYLS
jgi:hypothetical protein